MVVGYWAVEIRTRTGAERVRHMVDWDASCKSVELTRSPARLPDYARLWKGAEERARMWCTEVGPSVTYARFASEEALRREIRASPPVYRICDGLNSRDEFVTSLDRVAGGRAFRRRCARRGGKMDEGTERYCVAGDEVVVDGFDDEPGFEELCDDLDGRFERPPRSVLDR